MPDERERYGHTRPCPGFWNIADECICELIDAHDDLATLVIDLRDPAEVHA